MYFSNFKEFRKAYILDQIEYIKQEMDRNNAFSINEAGDELMHNGHAMTMHFATTSEEESKQMQEMKAAEDRMLERVIQERKSVSMFDEKDTAILLIENEVFQNVDRICNYLSLTRQEQLDEYPESNGKLILSLNQNNVFGHGIDTNFNEVSTSVVTMAIVPNPDADLYFDIRTAYPDITKGRDWVNRNFSDTRNKNSGARKTGKSYRNKAIDKIKNEKNELNKLYWGIKLKCPELNINYNVEYNAVYVNLQDEKCKYNIKFSDSREPVIRFEDENGKGVIDINDKRISDKTKDLINTTFDVYKNIHHDAFFESLKRPENIKTINKDDNLSIL